MPCAIYLGGPRHGEIEAVGSIQQIRKVFVPKKPNMMWIDDPEEEGGISVQAMDPEEFTYKKANLVWENNHVYVPYDATFKKTAELILKAIVKGIQQEKGYTQKSGVPPSTEFEKHLTKAKKASKTAQKTQARQPSPNPPSETLTDRIENEVEILLAKGWSREDINVKMTVPMNIEGGNVTAEPVVDIHAGGELRETISV